jgi:hypothetical protein
MAEAAKTKPVEIPAALVTNVGAAATGIVSAILEAAAGATLDSLKGVIKDYAGSKVGVAYSLRAATLDKVPDIVEDALDFDYKIIIDALKAGIGQGVGGVHGSLFETLIGTNALLTGYNGLIQRIGIDPYISRWVNKGYRPNVPDAETAWYMSKLGLLTDDAFKDYAGQSGWDDSWIAKLPEVWTSPAPIGTLLDLRRRTKIDDVTLDDQLRRYRLSDGMIGALHDLVVQYPEPYRLADFRAKGWIGAEILNDTMAKFGLSSDWAEIYAASQEVYPSFELALALLRRGEISSEVFTEYLRHNAYSGDVIPNLEKLKDVIPPIQDLIRFAVREAYLDHDPEKQYPEMVRRAGLMGLTPQDAEHYWYSHWERIPVNLMYANYHRGLWDVKKLEHMLKIVDVHPDDRQDIINVAYGPPSIREMGYGFDVGVYSLEDIKRFRRWGGLSPEDAEKAGEAMVAYRTEAERNSVRTELMYAFGLEKIDEDTLRARLAEIKTPDAALELWVTRAKLYRERIKKPAMDVEGRIVSSSEALTAFKLGLRNEEWLRNSLKALDWTSDRIDTAVERAKLEISEKEKEAAEVKYRKLTLAQIKQMYTIHLINKEEMTTEFVLVGYSPDDAELLTEIYTREVPVEVKPKPFTSAVAANMYNLMLFDEDDLYDNFRLSDWSESEAAMLTMYTILVQEYPRLRTMYAKGVISGEQMVKELMKFEVPEYNARLLVKKTYEELQIDRLSHEKDLTKAEIIKGVKNQVLTPSQGAELLQGIGYDENEAWYILAINKVVSAGDPDGYWEMRRVTETYKKARGEKALDIPDELIMLERQLKEAKAKLDELKKTPEREEEIKALSLKLIPIEQRMAEIVKGLRES